MLKKVCHRCGQPYQRAITNLHNFDVEFIYGDEHDGDIWNFNLCGSCVCEIVKQFALLPNVTEKTELI